MQTQTPPPSLADLQRWLRRVFTDPRGIQKALTLPGSFDTIADAPPRTAEDRLGVYAGAYVLRLMDALAADFPATRRALGEKDFHRLAADYLSRHPSSSPSISDVGEALAGFIATHRLAARFRFLPDLARLEWAVLESLYDGRLPPLDPAGLQNVPESTWPDARLVLDPTVKLLRTDWAVDRLWERRRWPEKKLGSRLRRKSPRALLLYRDEEWVQLRALDGPRWFTLQRLKEGVSLGRTCQELAAQFHRQAKSLPVMDWFAQWARAGVIKKIELPNGLKNR